MRFCAAVSIDKIRVVNIFNDYNNIKNRKDEKQGKSRVKFVVLGKGEGGEKRT